MMKAFDTFAITFQSREKIIKKVHKRGYSNSPSYYDWQNHFMNNLSQKHEITYTILEEIKNVNSKT